MLNQRCSTFPLPSFAFHFNGAKVTDELIFFSQALLIIWKLSQPLPERAMIPLCSCLAVWSCSFLLLPLESTHMQRCSSEPSSTFHAPISLLISTFSVHLQTDIWQEICFHSGNDWRVCEDSALEQVSDEVKQMSVVFTPISPTPSPVSSSLHPDRTLTRTSIVKDSLSVFILPALWSIWREEICKLMWKYFQVIWSWWGQFGPTQLFAEWLKWV